MLPNNSPGFYIVAKDGEGKVRIVRFYETLERLVRNENYRTDGYGNAKYFSEDVNEKVPYHSDSFFFKRWSTFYDDWLNDYKVGAYVVIDHEENVVPLCDLNRISKKVFVYRRYRYRFRRTAWGRFRHVRTYAEKKAYYDTLEQDHPIKVRYRRKPNALPDLWDDMYAHNEKSWKRQSKRRHQWKEK